MRRSSLLGLVLVVLLLWRPRLIRWALHSFMYCTFLFQIADLGVDGKEMRRHFIVAVQSCSYANRNPLSLIANGTPLAHKEG